MKKVLFILLVFISFNGFSQSVKIGIEVKTEDLGETDDVTGIAEMTWEEAKKACEKLGDGWRLPTIEELKFIYVNRDKLGVFKQHIYWSSTELDGISNTWGSDGAWYVDFRNGAIDFGTSFSTEYYSGCVRAVRDLK